MLLICDDESSAAHQPAIFLRRQPIDRKSRAWQGTLSLTWRSDWPRDESSLGDRQTTSRRPSAPRSRRRARTVSAPGAEQRRRVRENIATVTGLIWIAVQPPSRYEI